MYAQQQISRKNSQSPSSVQRSRSEVIFHTQKTLPSPTKTQFRKRSLKVKNIRLQQGIDPPIQKPQQAVIELRFLEDVLKRKQQPLQIPQIQPSQPSKPIKEYQYYDSIVRNLISQIRSRSTRDSLYSNLPQKPIKFTSIDTTRVRSPTKDAPPVIRIASGTNKMVFSLSLSGSDTVYERKITSYIEFLYKINFANCLYTDLSLSLPKSTSYRVRIGPGNNSLLVKSLLKRRFWLQIVGSGQCSFSWTQLTEQSIHDGQLPVPKKHEHARDRPTPRKPKLLTSTSEDILKKILRKQQIPIVNQWYERSDCGRISCFPTNQSKRISNHIPLNCIIGAKRILFRIVSWYYREILELDPFTVLPKTYSFEGDCAEAVRSFALQSKQHCKVWIVKPGQNSNRGNGIKVMQTPALVTLLNRQRGSGRPLIVQEYIKPFLYCGRKFDIRHYLLVTSVNGWIRAYWYKEGYIRTSSEKYDMEDLSDELVHLTNDAVQKRGERYGKFEPANKLSYSQFQRYLDSTHPHKHYNFEAQILQRMKDITTDMVRASFIFMDPQRKCHNFQLYGLDFYISSKFHPYLIECNANPCLQVNCPILERIIPGAIEHALRLGLDPLLPPPTHYPPSARYQLCDKVIDRLKYELIFDEKIEGAAIRDKTQTCRPLDLGSLGLKPEQDLFEDEGSELAEGANLD